jgi:squalene-hopene/tetraprenyl-beta-curcumene cyclase
MNIEVDFERVQLAAKAVRAELLAEREPDGHWAGQVSSSPVATAAAVSALVVAHHQDSDDVLREVAAGDGQVIQQLVQGDLSELLLESVQWLACRQNDDGGWGDCDGAESNVAATMLVQAAFRLTGIPARYADLMMRADQFVAAQGGLAGLRRQIGWDKTYLATIVANCALADMLPWRQVPTLQFEWLSVPRGWLRFQPVPSPGVMSPLVLAVGLAKLHHDPPRNPIMRLLRRGVRQRSLASLQRLQAADDSFLGSPWATAVVVMNVAGMGCQDHAIVRRGIEFLLSSVRADSSWGAATNLATIHTAMAVDSVLLEGRSTASGWNLISHDEPSVHWRAAEPSRDTTMDAGGRAARATSADDVPSHNDQCIEWLLTTQHAAASAIADDPAGGWAASDAPGAEPNTIATAGALLALNRADRAANDAQQYRVKRALRLGVNWLLELQNEDGGWPTFQRGDGALPQMSSGVDPTAQALRALAAWRQEWNADVRRDEPAPAALVKRINRATARGVEFLQSQQRGDGRFVPLWFGSEQHPDDENPVLGTAQVLAACDDLQLLSSDMAARAAAWLITAQHSGGGWGPPRVPIDYSDDRGLRSWRENETLAKFCSVEETSAAVSALLPLTATDPAAHHSVSRGLQWLANAVEEDAHRRPAIVGFYFSRIWYYDRLYPLAFAAGALSRAVAFFAPARPAATPVG